MEERGLTAQQWRGNQIGLGVDVGSALTKIVLARTDRWGILTVDSADSVPTPESALHYGEIRDPDLISSVLHDYLQQAGIKFTRVTASSGRWGSVVRQISLPTMPQKELLEAVRWQAVQYLPGDVGDVCADFIPLPDSGSAFTSDEVEITDDAGQAVSAFSQTDVVVVAVRKNIVRSHIEALFGAGLEVQAVEVPPVADIRSIYGMGYLGSGGTRLGNRWAGHPVAVINMGHSGTDLIIYVDGVPLMARQLSFGGESLLDRAGRALKLRANVIDRHLFDIGRGIFVRDREIEEDLKEFLEVQYGSLYLSIRRSLEYFVTRSKRPVKWVFLGGGYAVLPGLRDSLSQYLNEAFSDYVFADDVLGVTEALPINVMVWARGNQGDGPASPVMDGLDPKFLTAFGLAIRDFQLVE